MSCVLKVFKIKTQGMATVRKHCKNSEKQQSWKAVLRQAGKTATILQSVPKKKFWEIFMPRHAIMTKKWLYNMNFNIQFLIFIRNSHA